MPQKPKPGSVRSRAAARPQRKDGRKRQPNQWGGNEFRISFARMAMGVDGKSYSETRAAIVEKFRVHKGTAELDIKEAKRQNHELITLLVADQRPALIARQSVILDNTRIAAHAAGQYAAETGAIREFNDINGLHVEVVAVGPTNPEQQALIQALVMTPYQRQRRIAELNGQPIATEPAEKPASEPPPDDGADE